MTTIQRKTNKSTTINNGGCECKLDRKQKQLGRFSVEKHCAIRAHNIVLPSSVFCFKLREHNQ